MIQFAQQAYLYEWIRMIMVQLAIAIKRGLALLLNLYGYKVQEPGL